MFELAQQITYYLSLVDGGASSRLVSIGQQLASVTMIANTAKASFQSMIAPLQQVGSMWSRREQEINNITRTLRQYGYVGQSIAEINRDIANTMPGASADTRNAEFTRRYNDQFAQGRAMARQTIAEMAQIAAVLPGELSDYTMSLSQNLPMMAQAGMGRRDATSLISYLQAGAIAAGIDSDQAARDLTQFLTMGPHMVDRSWMEVWKQYARDPRTHQQLSAERIRAMPVARRIEVLQDIANQLGPLMNATGDSYEALTGTLTSIINEFKLAVTEPIFDRLKNVIANLNRVFGFLLERAAPLVGIFVKPLAAEGGKKLERAVNWFTVAFEKNASRLEHLIPVLTGYYDFAAGHLRGALQGVGAVGGRWVDYVKGQYGAHYGNVGAGEGAMGHVAALFAGRAAFTALAATGAAPIVVGAGIALAAILGRMLVRGQLNSTFAALAGAGQLVMITLFRLGSILYRTWDAFAGIVQAVLQLVLPTLVNLFGAMLAGAIGLVTALFNVLMQILAAFAPVLMGVVAVFMGLWALVDLLVAVFRVAVLAFTSGSTETTDFVDKMRTAVSALQDFSRELTDSLNYLKHHFGLMTDEEYQLASSRMGAAADRTPQWMHDMRAAMETMRNRVNETLGNTRPRGAPPQRPHTTQDFRYSRFDITQKFAEGFDPDRIASAFASDLEAMASQRLQSGFTPVGSVG